MTFTGFYFAFFDGYQFVSLDICRPVIPQSTITWMHDKTCVRVSSNYLPLNANECTLYIRALKNATKVELTYDSSFWCHTLSNIHAVSQLRCALKLHLICIKKVLIEH